MTKSLLICISISLSAAAAERSDISTIKAMFENKILSWHDQEHIQHYTNALPQFSKVKLPKKMQEPFEEFFNDISDNDLALLNHIKDHMSREFKMTLNEEQLEQIKSWPKPVREIVRIYVQKPQPSFGQAVFNVLRCKL